MLITIIILVLSAIFFVNGKIRSDIVALCALVALLVFQILTPDEALSGFSNSVVIMMIGLFVVGGAIFQTGLAKMISSRILKLAGTSEIRLFLLVMLVTSAIGAFVSNTGTVALMLPIVVSLAMSAGMNPSRLLMPLAFASGKSSQGLASLQKGSQLAAGSGGSPDYAEGDRVRHVKFGEGTVLEIRSGGRDYEVTVDFDSAGVRKMFAKFAKLVKIS